MALQRRKPAAIGVKARFPGFVEPALASSIANVPAGERWIHEIKFDGYRVQLHIFNSDIHVYTRRGHDWTMRFRKIASDAFLINAGSAIIDGEVVVPAADGSTDFSVLHNELKGNSDHIMLLAAPVTVQLRSPVYGGTIRVDDEVNARRWKTATRLSRCHSSTSLACASCLARSLAACSSAQTRSTRRSIWPSEPRIYARNSSISLPAR